MKNPLQSLLIVFALCLCALIAFQWHREAALREQIQKITNTGQENLENIRGLQSARKSADEEIKRLDGLKTELAGTVKSNQTQIVTMMNALEKRDLEVTNALKQVEVYKTIHEKQQKDILEQNKGVEKLKEVIQTLVAERDKWVSNYTKLGKEYDDLAQKWNDAQAAASAAAAKK